MLKSQICKKTDTGRNCRVDWAAHHGPSPVGEDEAGWRCARSTRALEALTPLVRSRGEALASNDNGGSWNSGRRGCGLGEAERKVSERRGDGGSRQQSKDDGSGAVNGRRRPDPAAGSSCAARRTEKAPASAPAGGSVELVTSWSGRSIPGAMDGDSYGTETKEREK